MPAILIITGAHLCRNPRVVKEASALARAGHEVEVLGPSFDDALEQLDARILANGLYRRTITIDLRRRNSANARLLRMRRRAAAECTTLFRSQSPHSLGYGLSESFALARTRNFDLAIGHQEVGLWVCWRLAQEGRTIGVDVEDWYSEDLMPEARRSRPLRLLATMEREVLSTAAHATTTSHAMAGALAAAYEVPPPAVVYNAFPWSDRQALPPAKPLDGALSLYWFSQTIGPGRGLELVIEALRQVSAPVELHLRGRIDGDFAGGLSQTLAHTPHRLSIHDTVPPQELLPTMQQHHAGLALDLSGNRNRDLTVTNKILHFLVGGLPVIATDTAGQREIAARAPGAVTLVPQDNPARLADAISTLASDPRRHPEARRAALEAAERELCWERQEPVLLQSVAQALGKVRCAAS